MNTRERRPRIGVPVDVKQIGDDPIQGVGEKYLAAVAHGATAIPILLPALGAGSEIDALDELISADDLLDGLDGLFLTGSVSNVGPVWYGGAQPGIGPFDAQRDATTLVLVRAAIARDMPVLAVCRGFQELNVACGGSLYQAVHDEPGHMDHRDDHDAERAIRYRAVHPVQLAADGLLARLAGATEITVNSLHGQGIDRLAADLVCEASAPDGLVEAARHASARFVVGIQWHPEWRFAENTTSRALFAAFGEAARAFHARPR